MDAELSQAGLVQYDLVGALRGFHRQDGWVMFFDGFSGLRD